MQCFKSRQAPCCSAHGGSTHKKTTRIVSHIQPVQQQSQPTASAPAPTAAAAVSQEWRQFHPSWRGSFCCSRARAAGTQSGSSSVIAQDEQLPIQVSVNSSVAGISRAIMYQMQHYGCAEVWASSAANHFTAISALAQAQAQLLEQPLLMEPSAFGSSSSSSSSKSQSQRPSEGSWCNGLAAVATLSAHDQPVKDTQKRRLLKLTLQVQPAAELDAVLLQPGQPGSISSNRTKGVADVLGLLQQQLLEPALQDGGAPSSSAKAGAVCVVEARGEQAVTRALKAALSLQAATAQPLLLRPVAGKVVDIVAEKRGQSLLADGLLLVWAWA